jgi:hypothetical protein
LGDGDDGVVSSGDFDSSIDKAIEKIREIDYRGLMRLLTDSRLMQWDPNNDMDATSINTNLKKYVADLKKINSILKSLDPGKVLNSYTKSIEKVIDISFLKGSKKTKTASNLGDATPEGSLYVAYNLKVAAYRILLAADVGRGDTGKNWNLYSKKWVSIQGKGQQVLDPKMFEVTGFAQEFITSLTSHGFDFIKNPREYTKPDGSFDREKYDAALDTKIDDIVGGVQDGVPFKTISSILKEVPLFFENLIRRLVEEGKLTPGVTNVHKLAVDGCVIKIVVKFVPSVL